MEYVDDPLVNFQNLDYTGLNFLTIALGGMQITLDKGLWWEGLGFILTEMRARVPIRDLSSFRFKSCESWQVMP
jgi:hypothetical protein